MRGTRLRPDQLKQNKCSAKMAIASRGKLRLSIVKSDNVAGFFCGARAWTTVESWKEDNVIGCEAVPVDGSGSVVGGLWHRNWDTAWIEECKHEFPGSHQRAIVLLGLDMWARMDYSEINAKAWRCRGTYRGGDGASTLQRGRERQNEQDRIQKRFKNLQLEGYRDNRCNPKSV